MLGGAWVAQWVKCLTLDFSSGHDFTVCGIKHRVSLCANVKEPAWDSPPLSLSLCPSPAFTLSLKKNFFLMLIYF